MSATRDGSRTTPARLRAAGPADFPAIAAVRNACRAAEGQPAAETADGVAESWTEPGCDLARDCVVAELADGTVAGSEEVHDRGSYRVYDCWGGDVLPEHHAPGIRDALLAWAEARVRARIRELLGDDAFRGEVRLQTTKPPDAPAPVTAALERAGFRPLRTFVKMRAPLPDAAELRWPEGVRVETFRPGDEKQARELWQARVDSFADHWGAVPPDPELGMARLRHESAKPDFDPTWMWAARDGSGRVAGICFCRGAFLGDDELGFVGHLGVVPEWRRRGLARALLRHAMAELKRRGRTACELGVDAEHPTGARELYGQEGFRERGRIVAWGKRLRREAPEEGAGS